MTVRKSRILCLVSVCFAVACGDGALVDYRPGEDKPEYEGEGYKLEVVTPMPLVLQPLSTGLLTVRLTKQDEPVSGINVAFAISDTAGAGGARVASLRVPTGASGEASVEVIAGGEEATFQVAMESQYTQIIYADIEVRGAASNLADLKVQVAYPDQGTQPVQRVSVTVHDATQVDCTALTQTQLPTALQAAQDILDLANSVTFTGFPGGQVVTVIAIGHNATAPVADGCVQNVTLPGAMETLVEVPLTARTLRLEGVYDYSAEFDMGNAIPGTAGDVIQTIGDMFDHQDDPGLYLVDQVGVLMGTDFGFLKSTIVDTVNSLLRQYVPESFFNFFQWVGDAASVVTALNVEGSLTVAPNAQGALEAAEVWEYVVFRWRGGCDPATSPLCDQRRIALRNTRIGELTMRYPITHTNMILNIAEHTRDIPYARFFHTFILQVVYPEIVPGATDSGDILQSIINCTSVAQWIADADGNTTDGVLDISIATFDLATIEGACNTGLDAVGNIIDGELDDLAADLNSTVSLQGAAEIHDRNNDLLADSFENGSWAGSISVDGAPEPVVGSFEASRR